MLKVFLYFTCPVSEVKQDLGTWFLAKIWEHLIANSKTLIKGYLKTD